MIDKKIHYIWFGNKKTSEVERCINSWIRYLPDYEIIEWNEENIDIEKEKRENKFFRECYNRRLWAYVADYLRTKILYEHGGIYFDTDIEVIKNMDNLLEADLFLGYENEYSVNGAVMGGIRGHKFFKKMLDFYNDEIWRSNLYILPGIITKILKDLYGKNLEFKNEKIKIYSREYFYPYNHDEEFTKECIKESTYTIHWWGKSWNKNPNVYYLKYKHLSPIKRKLKYGCKLINFYLRKLKIKNIQ